jgi:hypothetical protein
MDVEPVDAAGGECRDDVRVQVGGERLRPARSSRNRAAVGDLGRVEKDVPGGGLAQDAVPANARSAASS